MNASIERARSGRPVTWLTLLGILLLPVVIGGILVAALQNPTQRLDSMTAAIVNLDEPVTVDGQYTPLGRQLAAGLVDGTDELDSNLDWVISNEGDAADGLEDGTYQAVITIPAEFSAAAMSGPLAISGEASEPEQAMIEVTTPDDSLIADDLISAQIASAAASAMGSQLSEATLENVLVGFSTMGEQLGEAADGATRLADGASQAAEGAAALPEGATSLADGVSQLGSGASDLGSGASQLADGASQLAGGAGQIANGAGSLAGGLDTIADSTREAGSGAIQLGQGLSAGSAELAENGLVPDELFAAASGAQQATSGVAAGVSGLSQQLTALVEMCDPATTPELCAGLAQAAGTAGALIEPSAGAAAAAAGTSTGLGAFDEAATAELSGQLGTAGAAASALGDGLGQLAAGVDQSADGARDLGSGARGISSGAADLGSGVGQLADGAGALSSGAGQLADGATQLADGSTELVDGLSELAGGTEELAGGLATAVDSLPSFSEDESASLASVIAAPVSSNTSLGTVFGPTAIPLLAAVVLWFGALASFIVLRPVPASTLTSRRSSFALAGRAFLPAGLLGAGQGLLVALIVQFVADYDAAAWWAFAGVAVLAGVAFAAVNQALAALFGGIGRWISALVGVVAVGTGIISTVPGWLFDVAGLLPTSPAFAGLIAPSGSAVAALAVWGVLSLVVTVLAVTLRRTTSAKRVLATA